MPFKNPEEAKEYHTRYRQEHRQRIVEYLEEWRSNPENRKKNIETAKEWRGKNKGRTLAYRLRWRTNLKKDVLEHYGGSQCACCGEKTIEFLTLDHINNDGAEFRKKFGKHLHGWGFFRWLKNNSYPALGLQALCWNCNSAKGFFGDCPHNALRTG